MPACADIEMQLLLMLPTDSNDPLFVTNFAVLLQRAAGQFGQRPAIRLRDRTTTFAELGARAGAIAARLRGMGIARGQICAVLARDPAQSAAAFFGALAAGCIGVNVNELYRPRQIEYVLNHSKASAILTTDDVLSEQPRSWDVATRVLNICDLERDEASLEVDPADADSAAQVTYTSASTGLPKGVLMSHRALWAGVRIVAAYLHIQPSDRIAGLLPFSFVYGFNQLTTALFAGATLVVERSTLAADIAAALARERITVLAAVPPLWNQLMSVSAFRTTPLPNLRVMTCAGGRLPPASVRRLRAAQPGARLFLMYGLTEVFRSTYLPPEDVDAHPDSMGRAIPESRVYVTRDDETLIEDGEIGELVHGGPTVGLGYLGDPEATARVFRPNPFAAGDSSAPPRVVFSGDLVRRDEHGLLYYVARRDRIIKTLGFRVSPDEVSDVIQASGAVQDAAVISEPDDVRGERIVACIVLRPDASVSAVTRFCRIELPRHMQPARYVSLDHIPRNSSGKHDLLALRTVAAERGA